MGGLEEEVSRRVEEESERGEEEVHKCKGEEEQCHVLMTYLYVTLL